MTIVKIVRTSVKSMLITFEDGTYEKWPIRKLIDYFAHTVKSGSDEYKLIVSFFEDREVNGITRGLYNLYDEAYRAKI